MPSVQMRTFGDFADPPVPDIEFRRVLAPSICVPPPPRFILGSIPAEILTRYYSQQGIGSIGVYIARNLSLSHEYLLARDGIYLRCPELNITPSHVEDAVARQEAVGSIGNRRYLFGPHVMLVGPGHRAYGHWLIEHLPKLAVLKAAGFEIAALKFLLPTSIANFGKVWLELLGIRIDQLVYYDSDLDIIEAEELLLPTILHNGTRVSGFLQNVVAFFKDQIGSRHASPGPSGYGERLFISRSRASQSRPMANRRSVEEIAQRAGFVIVCPEQLPLLEQIQLFAHAKQLIGEYGSALHTSIFSEPGTVVCAMRGDGLHPGFIQSGIGHVLDQPTGYVFGKTNEADPARGFLLDEALLETALRLVFRGVSLTG
jgi:capsular polysaccharide biosynthesis protein